MARTVTPSEVNQLARLGAAVRLQQLEEEAAALRKMFPGLARAEAATASGAAPMAEKKPRRKGGMSASAREAARDRMRAYWARKKGEQASAAGGEKIEAADRPGPKARARRAGRKGAARKRTKA